MKPLLYFTSVCLYLGCVYGAYNLVVMEAGLPESALKEISVPAESESGEPDPSSASLPVENASSIENTPETLGVQSETVKSSPVLSREEAGSSQPVSANNFSSARSASVEQQGMVSQAGEMVSRAAETLANGEGLKAASGSSVSSASSSVQGGSSKLSAAVGQEAGAGSMAAVSGTAMPGNVSLPPSAPQGIQQQVKQAQALTESGNLPDPSSPVAGIDKAAISGAMKNLSSNVAAISSVPDSLKDAIGQSGINAPMVDPNNYFAGAPPVTAGSVGLSADPDKKADPATMVQNLALLGAAAGGLADMAASMGDMDAGINLPVPPPLPPPAPAGDPQAKPPQASEPASPNPEAKKSDEKKPDASKEKQDEEEKPPFPWDTLLSLFAGVGLLVFVYLKFTRRKVIRNPEEVLKKKYEEVNKLGWAGDFNGAHAALCQILATFPKELDARFFLGGLLWRKLNNPHQAIMEYRRLEQAIKEQGITYKYMEQLNKNIRELDGFLAKKAEAL